MGETGIHYFKDLMLKGSGETSEKDEQIILVFTNTSPVYAV